MWTDVQIALRSLRKSPQYFLPAVVTLGFGLGLCTAMFTIVNTYLLRPLPVDRGEDLVMLAAQRPGRNTLTNQSYPNFNDIQSRTRELSGLVSYVPVTANLRGATDSRQIWGQVVSGGYFPFLGIQPRTGRSLTPADDHPSANPVAVVSSKLWTNHFHSDPAVVGRVLLLNGSPFAIVGVMPDGFRGTDAALAAEFWIPLAVGQAAGGPSLDLRRGNLLRTLGRLRPGGSLAQAQAEMDVIAAALRKDHPDENREVRIIVKRERNARPDVGSGGYVAPASMFLMGFAGLFLVICCANVTSLSLARATMRRKTAAIQLAMGSSRFRILRQFAVEGILISLSGGLLALFVVTWITDWLSQATMADQSVYFVDLQPDMRVFAFTLLLSSGIGIALAAIAAPSALRGSLSRSLASRDSSLGRGRTRLQSFIVVSQFAVLSLLLVCGGMLVQGLVEASRLDLGFRGEHVALMSVAPAKNGYPEPRARRLIEDLAARTAALPGVRAVSVADNVPFGPSSSSTEVRPADRPDEDASVVSSYSVVSQEYFNTIEMPLLRGRAFDIRDQAHAQKVAVVNQALANRLWPGHAALHRQVLIQLDDEPAEAYEVVGVTQTGKYNSIHEPPRNYVYLSYAQHTHRPMTILVRTSDDAGAIVSSVRGLLEELEPNVPLFDVTTLADRVDAAKAPIAWVASVGGAGGLLGTALAGLGMYALMSYLVVLNARGLALRVALGSTPALVIGSVVRRGLQLAGLGLLTGLAAAFAGASLFRGSLFGVAAPDPVTVTVVAFVVAGSTTVACYLPARRMLAGTPLSSLLKD